MCVYLITTSCTPPYGSHSYLLGVLDVWSKDMWHMLVTCMCLHM